MNEIQDTTAIILAGGKSSRMGTDKGLMLVDNKPMIVHIIDTVSSLTPNVLIVANHPDYKKLGYPTVADQIAEKGPLGGIVTGLSRSKTDRNWILSCDTPYLQSELLLELMKQLKTEDAVIPVYEDRTNPITAVYRKSALPVLQESLELGRLKLTETISGLNVRFFDANQFDLCNFRNLNSPADL